MKIVKEIKEFIFTDNRPFLSCHASTIGVFDDQSVLAAWFGGSKEGAEDVRIWYSKKTDNRWTKPMQIPCDENVPHWNPVLFIDNEKTFLFYKVGQTIREWVTMFTISLDGGINWSKADILVKGDKGGRGPVKNKPIVLSDGTYLAPASIENETWDSFVDISYDKGSTWEKSRMVPRPIYTGKGVIQPTIWESEAGNVHMLLRSTEGKIYRSDSKDSGCSWSEAYATNLPNNNSGIDIVKIQSGKLLLCFNPVNKNWGDRTPLNIAMSNDNGQNWETICVLEDMPGEYSYPSIVSKENSVFLTYTWKRQRIVFVQLDLISLNDL